MGGKGGIGEEQLEGKREKGRGHWEGKGEGKG